MGETGPEITTPPTPQQVEAPQTGQTPQPQEIVSSPPKTETPTQTEAPKEIQMKETATMAEVLLDRKGNEIVEKYKSATDEEKKNLMANLGEKALGSIARLKKAGIEPQYPKEKPIKGSIGDKKLKSLVGADQDNFFCTFEGSDEKEPIPRGELIRSQLISDVNDIIKAFPEGSPERGVVEAYLNHLKDPDYIPPEGIASQMKEVGEKMGLPKAESLTEFIKKNSPGAKPEELNTWLKRLEGKMFFTEEDFVGIVEDAEIEPNQLQEKADMATKKIEDFTKRLSLYKVNEIFVNEKGEQIPITPQLMRMWESELEIAKAEQKVYGDAAKMFEEKNYVHEFFEKLTPGVGKTFNEALKKGDTKSIFNLIIESTNPELKEIQKEVSNTIEQNREIDKKNAEIQHRKEVIRERLKTGGKIGGILALLMLFTMLQGAKRQQ